MFINRESELRELEALAERRGPALGLVYGRRRVGKTYLLDHAWPERRVFYYLAADATDTVNRRELLEALATRFELELEPEDYPTWRSVFRLLVDLASESALVVVLDEFQYLMGGEDEIVSQLVAVWDREVRARELTLVLCGSEVGTMRQLEGGASPLYGRINWSVRLRPFDYWNAGQMVRERPVRDRAYVYGVFGGTPRFLSALQAGDRLDRRIMDTVLSPRGEVHLQLATIIQQERGIREVGDYQSVLKAVAEGRRETNEIAAAAGFQERPHVARRVLEMLEDLLLIRRERNFGASSRAPWRHRLADNALQFWYRFVHPNRGRLERGEVDKVWHVKVAPYLDDYMGWSVFEGMAGEAFQRMHGELDLPAANEWSRWEGRDRNRRSIEVDIVAALDDGRLLTGEVKWSSRPVDTDVHFGLRRDLEDLAASGQGWARDALADASAGHIYFSAAGFSAHFRKLAERDRRIRLVELADMYPE